RHGQRPARKPPCHCGRAPARSPAVRTRASGSRATAGCSRVQAAANLPCFSPICRAAASPCLAPARRAVHCGALFGFVLVEHGAGSGTALFAELVAVLGAPVVGFGAWPVVAAEMRHDIAGVALVRALRL